MDSYHEIERFQRKAGQADFPFRHTGTPAHRQRETGWSLIDQVAGTAPAAAAAAVEPATEPARSPATVREVASARRPVAVNAEDDCDQNQLQDAALERFASLLKARQVREAPATASDDNGSLKQLLRGIALGAGTAEEHWPTRC
ncbi:MAG: hypothetical protein KFB92_06320 [Alcanivorax sp.]|nr:MAG: hypothetical protein KFB92_06320 [Alcanivorax sp.]